MLDKRISSCACGQVKCEGVGEPILTAVCYCDDCQAGGRMVESLADAPLVLEEDGGAAYLTYRDDRFECIAGDYLLKGYKLREDTPTTRFVASCCNTAMYLKFKPGHWVSSYRNRFEGQVSPIEMRSQTRFRNSDLPIPDEAPHYRRFPIRLFTKLIGAKMAMMFGR